MKCSKPILRLLFLKINLNRAFQTFSSECFCSLLLVGFWIKLNFSLRWPIFSFSSAQLYFLLWPCYHFKGPDDMDLQCHLTRCDLLGFGFSFCYCFLLTSYYFLLVTSKSFLSLWRYHCWTASISSSSGSVHFFLFRCHAWIGRSRYLEALQDKVAFQR